MTAASELRNSILNDKQYGRGNVFISIVAAMPLLLCIVDLVGMRISKDAFMASGESVGSMALLSSALLTLSVVMILIFLVRAAFHKPAPPQNIRRFRLMMSVAGLASMILPIVIFR